MTLRTLEKLILHQSVCREQNFRMSLRVIEIDITFSIFLLSGICAADKKMTSHVHSYTFCRIISGYLPFTKIGFANHPAENCNFVSQASMCSVSLKTNGSNQFTNLAFSRVFFTFKLRNPFWNQNHLLLFNVYTHIESCSGSISLNHNRLVI